MDDRRIHVLLLKELGSDLVNAVYQADNGLSLSMLTAMRRDRELTPAEIADVHKLAAGDLRRGKELVPHDQKSKGSPTNDL